MSLASAATMHGRYTGGQPMFSQRLLQSPRPYLHYMPAADERAHHQLVQLQQQAQAQTATTTTVHGQAHGQARHVAQQQHHRQMSMLGSGMYTQAGRPVHLDPGGHDATQSPLDTFQSFGAASMRPQQGARIDAGMLACSPCNPGPRAHAMPLFQPKPEVLIEFDLVAKMWRKIEGKRSQCVHWKEFTHPLNFNMLQSIKVTGRHSNEEKRGKAKAEQILRSPSWLITAKTPLEDIENLIVLLVKCLDTWTNKIEVDGQGFGWCVGGSLAQTINGRNEEGNASTLLFVGCSRANWVGNGRSKVSNTCAGHCAGLSFNNVTVGKRFHRQLVLRKCVWLKCCYGKKPFGAPPAIPWVPQCEFQKKMARAARVLEKRAAVTVSDDGHAGQTWGQSPIAAMTSSMEHPPVKCERRARHCPDVDHGTTSHSVTPMRHTGLVKQQHGARSTELKNTRDPLQPSAEDAARRDTGSDGAAPSWHELERARLRKQQEDADMVVAQLLLMGNTPAVEEDAGPEKHAEPMKRVVSYTDVALAHDALKRSVAPEDDIIQISSGKRHRAYST